MVKSPGEDGPANNGGELASSQLFHKLSAEELLQAERLTQARTCPAGLILYSPGDPADWVFLLKRGGVRLYRIAPSGRRVVIDMLSDGAVFGEMALVGRMVYDTFAEASEDCTLAVIARADIENLMATQPTIGMNLFDIIGLRLLVAEDVIERLAHPAIPSRLASLLLAVVDANGEVRGLSHGDLADRVGVRRETTTRVLNELRTAGVIALARERIRILDAPRLESIAAAD